MAFDDDEKSLDPTPHRRKLLRERGQVAHSQDLSSAVLLLGGLGTLAFAGAGLVEFLASFLGNCLSGQSWLAWLDADSRAGGQLLADQWSTLGGGLARVVLPIMGFIALAAVAINLLQTGFLFRPGKIVPDLSRINPLGGLARIASVANVARAGFGLLKLTVCILVAGACLYQRHEEVMSLAALDPQQLALALWDICSSTCLKVGFALLTLAAVDYGWQRWKLEREARMTPQEARDELRALQGNPQVAGRRREVRRQLAAESLSIAVPKADVVIAAAGGWAVALRYDAVRSGSPTITAKGAGILANRIYRLASDHRVPVVEKERLARALHKRAKVNGPVPDELLAEVAEVLAYARELRPRASA